MVRDSARPESASSKEGDADRHLVALARQLRQDTASEGCSTGSLNDVIRQLREQQNRQREERRKVQKELKNAARRKRRLKQKARQLTNKDLMEVLLMREDGQTQVVGESVGAASEMGKVDIREVEPVVFDTDAPQTSSGRDPDFQG